MRRSTISLVALSLLAACTADSGPTAIESNEGGVPDVTSLDTTPSTGATPPTTTDDATPPSTGAPPPTTTDDTTPPTGTGSTGATTPPTDGPAPGSLAWGDCDPDDVPATPASVPGTTPPECATLEVPLDYDDPDGEQIELALIRVPASGDRRGAILTNPGGPGGSGFEFIANAGNTIASELGADRTFDIVGFDPRGVDRSNGLDCVSDDFLDAHLYPDLTPDDTDERTVLDESETAVYEACRSEYGPQLRFYSTANTARDMDAIRQALGDDQISYLGISYGTYLGAVYATLFPDRVRAMVLDSAFEPGDDTIEQQYLTQLVGFEDAFDNWAAWCAGEQSCAFTAADADAVGERWDALFAQLDDQPLESEEGRTVNQSTMFTATIASMYSETSWPDLAASLAQAEDADPAGILRLADSIMGRQPDGTYQNIAEAGPVIRCASGLVQETPEDPQALLRELRRAAPRFSLDVRAEDLRNLCELMLDDPASPVDIGYDGEAPILVTGGANDPATPFRWAEELDALLGPSSVLVQFNGEGHGQLISSKCITEMEASTLVDLDPPDEGAECDPDPVVERPGWWDDLPTPDGISKPQPLPGLLSAFGLSPSQGYGEVRLTELSPDDVREAYSSALGGEFQQIAETEILPDVFATYFSSPDELVFLVLVVPPEAFEGKELESAKGIVPEGKTAVLNLALTV